MTQTAKLTASDGAAGDLFGWKVAIDVDTVVVGAAGDQFNSNPAHKAADYVFEQRPDTTTQNDWTVMVYVTAANTLWAQAVSDINEMEALAEHLPATVHFEVFYDQNNQQPQPTGSGGQAAWGNAGEGVIQGDDTAQIATWFTRLGEQNSGTPDTLSSFIEWAAAREPAHHYALVMWDHGGGIDGSNYDDESNDHLTTPEMAAALKRSQRRCIL